MLVEEDINPSSDKIVRIPDGWVLFNLTGVRTVIKRRESGTGYDITRGMISSIFQFVLGLTAPLCSRPILD
jgi:hypothetical protein